MSERLRTMLDDIQADEDEENDAADAEAVADGGSWVDDR